MSNKKVITVVLGVALSATVHAATDSVLMRLYGDRYNSGITKDPSLGTAGHLDTSFGVNGTINFTVAPYADYSAGAYISAMMIDQSTGWMYVAVEKGDGTNVTIEKMDADGNKASSGFGSSGKLQLNTSGARSIMFDAEGRILVCGGTGSAAGWIARVKTDGTLDTAFGSSGYVTVSSGSPIINKVAEQKSGRIIAVASNGKIYAFRSTGTVDNTFNPVANPGLYSVASVDLNNLLITSNDEILCAYQDTNIVLAKVKADGTGLVLSYGTSGIVDTGVAPVDAHNIYMAKDTGNKVYVAASTGSNIAIARLTNDSANSLDTYGSSGVATTASTSTDTSTVLRALMITKDNQVVVVADNGLSAAKVARFTTGGSVDTSFNSSGLYSLASLGNAAEGGFDGVYAAAVHADGSVFVGGDDQYSSDSHPTMIRLYGDAYDNQHILTYTIGTVGTLDTTFNNTGSLNLSSTYSLSSYVAKKIHMFDDGSVLLAFENTTDNAVKVVKLKKDMTTLDTTFGASSSGIRTLTSVTTDDSSVTPNTISDLLVTQAGEIYICGQTSDSSGWLVKLSSSGAVDTTFKLPTTVGAAFANILKVSQQKDSKIMISGLMGDSTLRLYSLLGTTAAVDTTFNAGTGYVNLTSTHTGYADLAVDHYDRLYELYKTSDSHFNIRRYLSYGTIDTTTADVLTNIATGTSGRVVVDPVNDTIVVAAVSSDGTFKVRRLTFSNNSSLTAQTQIEITPAATVASIADLFIDDVQRVYVVGTSSDNKTIVARLKDNSGLELDTDYNPLGSVPGVAEISPSGMTAATAAAVHPDRRVVVVGSGSGSAYMTRLFGDTYHLEQREELALADHGTIDYVFDKTNITGYVQDSTSNAVAQKIVYLDTVYKFAVAIDDGVNTVIKNIDLDGALSTAGTPATIPTGINSLFATTYYTPTINQKVILVGQSTGPWLQRVAVDGSADSSFNANGSALSLASSDITTANVAIEQKGGRIVVAGHFDDGDAIQSGVVVGYKNDGSATDVRFGQTAVTGSNAYRTGVDAPVQAMVVDGNDYMYISYIHEGTVYIEKIKPDGSGKVAAFNAGAAVATSMTNATGISQLALSSDGSKVIVACVNGGVIYAGSYLTTDGTESVAPLSLGAFTSITTPVLTDMQVASNNKAILIGYDSDNSNVFAARLSAANLTKDTSFNSVGYFTEDGAITGNPKSLYGVAVQPDGKIVVVGQSKTNNYPLISRLFADPYTSGVLDGVGQQVAGTQDVTADVSTGLDLNAQLSATFTKATLVHACADGSLIMVFEDASHSYVAKLQKDNTYDTGFGTSGKVQIASKKNASKLLVDENDNIFVTGTVGGSAWLFACNSTGAAVDGLTNYQSVTLSTTKTMSISNAVARQSLQRTLIAGYNSSDSYGAIFAYTNTGTLDTTFGSNNGYVNVASGMQISDMFVDSNDRIVVAYRSGTSVILKRYLPNGASLDTTFGDSSSGTLTIANAADGSTNNQIKLQYISSTGHIIITSLAGSSDVIKMYKYNSAGSSSSSVAATLTGKTPTITKAQIDSAGKLVVFGYNGTTSKPFALRVKADFSALDTNTFNPSGTIPGYYEPSTDSITTVYSATLLPDRRYIFVGADATPKPYMSRVHGDNYTTILQQNPSLATIGSVDTSLSLAHTNNYISLNSLASIEGTPKALTVYNNTYLISLIAGASNSYLTSVNVDGVVQSGFGTSGVKTITGKTDVVAMNHTDSNTLLVAGQSSTSAWVAEYALADGAAVTTRFGADGATSYSNITSLVNIVQQSTIRTILGGTDANGLVFVGINPSGVEDTSFAVDGRYADSDISSLSHFVLDQKNRIVAAYLDSTIKIMRLNKQGRSLDAAFNSTGIVDTGVSASASGAKLATDTNRKIYVAMASAAKDIILKRYAEDGATVATGTLEVGTTGFAAPVVTQVLVTASGKVYVLGYDENGSSDTMFVVAFKSDLTLDTSFSSDGYVTFSKTGSTASTRRLAAGVVLANGRLMVVGHEA